MYKPIVCSIAAVGPNDVIGCDGQMPWYSRQDFYHFRNTTTPYPCIFGRKTFEGMPKKPLPNRLNIVCSSTYKNEYKDGVFYADSVESAINNCADAGRLFICGGGAIYKYAIEKDLIDVMFLTKIKSESLAKQIIQNPKAYAYFPINTQMFFDGAKWQMKKINYIYLTPETNDITTEFFKFTRIR